ncbi:hypothetical protein [Peptacetobacter sp.]|uniref:hypothetical protein n=1 Tax=Peptacetobacter sp. TaxID=2991975 RepID=UPI00262635C1|nr:hypothetical protein [Peptacetobacter sp.]
MKLDLSKKITNEKELSDFEKTELIEDNKQQEELYFENILKIKELELEKWQKSLFEKEKNLEVEKIKIQQEIAKLDEKSKEAESLLKLKLDFEYSEAKQKLKDEQNKDREAFIVELDRKRNSFENERKKLLDELDKELKKARENTKKEIDEIRKNNEDELKKNREENEKEFQNRREEQNKLLKEDRERALKQLDLEVIDRTSKLTKAEQILNLEIDRMKSETNRVEIMEKEIVEREEKLRDKERSIIREKRRLERERMNIDEKYEDLESVVNEKIDDTIKSLNLKINIKDEEIERLREQLSLTIKEIDIVKNFKEVYKEDPTTVFKNIKILQEKNNELKNELANSTDKMEYDNLSLKYRNLRKDKEILLREKSSLDELKRNYPILESAFKALEVEHKALKATCESLENQLEIKSQELIRLSTPEESMIDRNARIEAIKSGILDDKKDLIGSGNEDSRYISKTEIEWLDSVWSKCEKYGIKFNKRILYAFHTALKINDWSIITVLAGVSGTGKSELPRLYSEFGGLNFCSVAVQPNWDSQESMLGFFNSIDNRFEAEELLKFLVQCTEDEKYKDYMSLVLLDEMNLAHVEHYFAEFLSKLETRRGLSKKYIPEVEVKLGAGVKPYGLRLSRTILWTGTMNQDETTKSLSDKVLDRGIIINFPRPRKLESRKKMELITEYLSEDRPKLHKETWQSWTTHKIEFSEEQKKKIEEYKNIVEEINDALENVGRALGHRVWQSIEYYIANYPTVRKAMNYKNIKNEEGIMVLEATNEELTGELEKAMKTAFEDQIVQKIMPKLRGIETRDKRGKRSLDEIEELLVNHEFTNLQEDFRIAREQGYGQFIWNTAKYLDEEEIEK